MLPWHVGLAVLTFIHHFLFIFLYVSFSPRERKLRSPIHFIDFFFFFFPFLVHYFLSRKFTVLGKDIAQLFAIAWFYCSRFFFSEIRQSGSSPIQENLIYFHNKTTLNYQFLLLFKQYLKLYKVVISFVFPFFLLGCISLQTYTL